MDVVVHSSQNLRRGKLEAWLDPTQKPQVAKFEWNAVQIVKGRAYSCDPTVKNFLKESARRITANLCDVRTVQWKTGFSQHMQAEGKILCLSSPSNSNFSYRCKFSKLLLNKVLGVCKRSRPVLAFYASSF
jgi:hypothetical protein